MTSVNPIPETPHQLAGRPEIIVNIMPTYHNRNHNMFHDNKTIPTRPQLAGRPEIIVNGTPIIRDKNYHSRSRRRKAS